MVRSHKIVPIRKDSGDSRLPPKDLFVEKPVSSYGLLTNIHSALQRWGLHYGQPVNTYSEAKPAGRTLILAVEPDREIAREYKNIFRKEGYDLEVVSSVTEAVKELRNLQFDCLIVDVDLPDMAGYDAVSLLKIIEQKINIIITAAKNTKELEARIRKEDIFYYYIKSFDREELKLAVRNALKRCDREVNPK